jgi:hypothetical protein
LSGWNLAGVGKYVINAEKFNNSNIKSVWRYDYNTKNYQSYIPAANNTLTAIYPYDGFWLNATTNFTLNLENNDTNTTTVYITPDSFIFNPINNLDRNISIISNSVTINGITPNGVNIGVLQSAI